jgi:hypothetical protein
MFPVPMTAMEEVPDMLGSLLQKDFRGKCQESLLL